MSKIFKILSLSFIILITACYKQHIADTPDTDHKTVLTPNTIAQNQIQTSSDTSSVQQSSAQSSISPQNQQTLSNISVLPLIISQKQSFVFCKNNANLCTNIPGITSFYIQNYTIYNTEFNSDTGLGFYYVLTNYNYNTITKEVSYAINNKVVATWNYTQSNADVIAVITPATTINPTIMANIRDEIKPLSITSAYHNQESKPIIPKNLTYNQQQQVSQSIIPRK